jgi:hypothetical protein
MLRLALLIVWVAFFFDMATGAPDMDRVPLNVPGNATPRKLWEAWLSFHETDLCQEVDAVFVFQKNRLEVWSRIESDKSSRKFLALFEPLKNSHSVELYTTRPPEEKKDEEDNDPPPSLCQNSELISNLGYRTPKSLTYLEEQTFLTDLPSTNSILRQLLIYAEQTLHWNERMERYALDLAALARVVQNPAAYPGLKSRTVAACAAHAQDLGRYIRKLAANLTQALPRSEKKKRPLALPEKSDDAGKDPVERAKHISAAAQGISGRVYRFIYPEQYTVELDELRNPSLLESLEVLRGMVSDFERSLPRHAGK